MPHASLKDIISLRDFKNVTRYRTDANVTKAKHAIFGQGKQITTIYTSLEKLEKHIDDKPALVVQYLWSVIVDCEEWLEAKEKKKGSNNFNTRATEVRKLLASTRKAFAELSFKSKAFEKGKSASGKPLAIPLAGGYQYERTAFEKSKKAFAPAASQVLGSNVNSYPEFMKKYEEIKKGDGKAQQVQYLRKKDRMDYLVVLEDGKFYSESGVLKESPDAKNSTTVYGEMYAMDRHGNLFVRDFTTFSTRTTGFGNFNHSSFNAGRQVICAGVCLFKAGRLVFVDNASGHYKPTRNQLQAMLAFLASHGHDLSRTRVDVFTTDERHVGSHFVNNPNGPAKWDPALNTSWDSGKDVSP